LDFYAGLRKLRAGDEKSRAAFVLNHELVGESFPLLYGSEIVVGLDKDRPRSRSLSEAEGRTEQNIRMSKRAIGPDSKRSRLKIRILPLILT
jgi:hypothetical protein